MSQELISPRTNTIGGSGNRPEEIPPVRTAAAEMSKALLLLRAIRKSGVGNLDKAIDDLDEAVVVMLASLWDASMIDERIRR